MKENISGVATTIRVPVPFLEKIKALSVDIGDSQNGVMMHLMFMGMKVYESEVKLSLDVGQSTQ